MADYKNCGNFIFYINGYNVMLLYFVYKGQYQMLFMCFYMQFSQGDLSVISSKLLL